MHIRLGGSSSLALAALLAALPLACGAAPAETKQGPPAQPAKAPLPAPASISGAPQGGGSASADPEEPPSPFHPVILNSGHGLRLFELGSFVLVVSGEFLSTPIRVDSSGPRVDRGLYAGLQGLGPENAFFVMWARGELPSHGSLGLNLPGDRGGTDVFYTWRGSSWKRAPDRPMPPAVSSAYYLGGIYSSVPWGDRTLYEINDPKHAGSRPIFVLGAGGKSPPVPEIAAGAGSCKTRLLGHADLVTLPSGDLIGLGKLCREGDQPSFFGQAGPGPLAVERWTRGSRTSVIEELPGSEDVTQMLPGARFFVLGPADVLAVAHPPDGGPYVAHWNGDAWSKISPVGSAEPVEEAFRTRDGALWLDQRTGMSRLESGRWTFLEPPGRASRMAWVTIAPDEVIWLGRENELLTLDKGGYKRVPLPRLGGAEEATPTSILFRGGETLVTVNAAGRSALLSTRKPAKVLDLAIEEDPLPGGSAADRPSSAAPRAEPHAFARVTPGTPACKELFVVLYKLAKVAPPDYDFPLTRAALKGHTNLQGVSFAETEDGGRRYFVGFVPSFGVGQELVKAVQRGVKGSTPQLLCGKPARTHRDIRIDLRTGEIVK